MRPAKEIALVDTIIIDCFYVAYRGFCSTPPLQSKDGTPTNAIHGILGAVRRMVKDLQPKSVIVATEGKTNLRDQMSADYKAGRELPPRFSQQIPLIYKMCKLSGWHLLESDGYEADDVIVTVGRRMRELHLRAAVFSTDKDIISRISDEFGIVGIFKTEKGKSFILEAADYTAKWGVPPALIPEVLCLCGDSVDNVPGIKGVGEKTAVRLIQEFGGVAGIYANLDKVKPDKLRALLDQPGSRASLKMSQELIQLNENLPIDDAIFQPGRQQAEDLHEFFLSLDMVKTAASLGPSPAHLTSDTVQTEFFRPALDGVEEFTHSVERVVITLLITERCNYRCSHCLYACSPSRSAAYISDEALQHVGRALHACSGIDDLPVLNILGGEPTLNPTEFSRIVKWITELRPSFRLSMVTNGWWLQSIRRLAQVAAALQPLWGIDEDRLRISISNTIWHDRFRTPRLQKMLRSRALGEVLSRLDEWYPASEVHLLDDSQRQAIAKMAAAARKEKLYVQCRMDSNSNLIYMGRAEENGLGRRSHLCSAADLSLTVWPDGSIRHVCDGAGKMQFGNIEQGIVGFWAVRKEFLARLHRRYNEPWSYASGNPRCEHCKAYAGYWLSQEKPKFDPDKNICKKPG